MEKRLECHVGEQAVAWAPFGRFAQTGKAVVALENLDEVRRQIRRDVRGGNEMGRAGDDAERGAANDSAGRQRTRGGAAPGS